MTINLLVAIELAFEAVERYHGIGLLPINIIEALAFQKMMIWTWSIVLELKIQVSFFKKNWRYFFVSSMISKVKEIGA
jgi:hypothetical protein